jgi:hypothetical protein
MFARIVTIHLKSNALKDFTQTLENQIIPMLRKYPGFRDGITFVSDNGMEITAISLWDSKEPAEKYSASLYPSVLESIGKFLSGKPQVRVLRVLNSTAHKLTASAVVAA